MNQVLMEELIEKSELQIHASGFMQHEAGFSITKTFTDFDVINTLTGNYHLIINGKVYDSKPKDFYLLPPGSSLKLTALEPSTQIYCHFSVFYAGKSVFASDFEDYKLPAALTPLGEQYSTYYKKYTTDLLNYSVFLKFTFKLILLEMILQSEKNYETFLLSSRHSFSPELLRLIHYIHENLDHPLGNEELSKFAGLNSSYFSRYFKKYMGLSPAKYITEVKMNVAKQMLGESDISSKEIAEKLGFSDQFVFSKKFKRYFSVTPSEFRKLNI